MSLFVLLAVVVGAGEAVAAEQMRFEQFLSELLLNNHALRAGVKSVEADYYAVLAGVGVQRPQVGLTAA